MNLSQIDISDFTSALRGPGICLRTGPFQTHVQSPIRALGRALHLLYSDFPVVTSAEFADFHLRFTPNKFRPLFRRQVLFHFDNQMPFKPLPVSHAPALFEWCFNWCIESQANQYLMMHAAVVEEGGFAALLAAPPGSGKSTLTAGLVSRGWRLLSDELTLIDPGNEMAVPLARPISLKNDSIQVIRNFVTDAVIGPVVTDTLKGSVAYLKPPADSVKRVAEPALPRWVIFPKFQAGAQTNLIEYPKSRALLRLADQAFNYSQFGVQGFELMASLIDRCNCYEFIYSRLAEAVETFGSLVDQQTSTITKV